MSEYEYDRESDMSGADSIFEGVGMPQPSGLSELPPDRFDYQKIENPNPIVKFFDTLSDNLLNSKIDRERKKLQKQINEFINENSDFLELLHNFDCKIIHKNSFIELNCGKYNLIGTVSILPDGTLKFDDTAAKIIRLINQEISIVNKLDDTLNEYEKAGFYPVGTPVETEINGRKILVGTLRNTAGEEIQIDIRTGVKITFSNTENM